MWGGGGGKSPSIFKFIIIIFFFTSFATFSLSSHTTVSFACAGHVSSAEGFGRRAARLRKCWGGGGREEGGNG